MRVEHILAQYINRINEINYYIEVDEFVAHHQLSWTMKIIERIYYLPLLNDYIYTLGRHLSLAYKNYIQLHYNIECLPYDMKQNMLMIYPYLHPNDIVSLGEDINETVIWAQTKFMKDPLDCIPYLEKIDLSTCSENMRTSCDMISNIIKQTIAIKNTKSARKVC